MNTTYPISIAVVDDHIHVWDGISNTLVHMGFHVIMQAEHGQDFLTQLAIASILPDLCLLDINMPVMNGLETALVLKQQWPGIKILGYTFDNKQSAEMLQCGADACLQKSCSAVELKKIILELFGIIG